jgi:transcription elongation GreA/GreB family factor
VRVVPGALVDVDEDGEVRHFFIAPAGGGTALAGGVQVLTPKSPLGAALVGKVVDDDVELVLAGRKRSLLITHIE